MDLEKESAEFVSSMPAIATGPVAVGATVYDEGVYVCVGCNIPGMEVSLMPGEEAPPCPRCGDQARWAKA